MANPYINLYTNNPTAGATDGTAISTDGTYTAPFTVTLDASTNESKIIPLGIRTESGYIVASDTTISDSGDTNDRWKFSLTSDTGWADSITLASDTVTSLNTIFYVKASSDSSESPQSDRSVSFQVSTLIQTVS